MDIDIMLYGGGSYPNERSVRFQALSPFIGETEIPVILSGVRKEVVPDPDGGCDYVWVARAYNEMGDEGYVIWSTSSSVCFNDKNKRYRYLWFESIHVFPKELWPVLLTNREEEKTDINEEEY